MGTPNHRGLTATVHLDTLTRRNEAARAELLDLRAQLQHQHNLIVGLNADRAQLRHRVLAAASGTLCQRCGGSAVAADPSVVESNLRVRVRDLEIELARAHKLIYSPGYGEAKGERG